MKKQLFLLTAALALSFAAMSQTVIPVQNAQYLPPSYADASKLTLTATNNAEGSTTFSWSGSPIGAVNYTSIGREYIGAMDTVGSCPGTIFNGIPNSSVACGAFRCPTAWDVPVHFYNNTCAPVASMTIKWNDYQLATNNSPEGCITFESYAGSNGALVTDGITHLYYLECFSLANMQRFKVAFNYTLPVLPHACPGQVIPEAPASITSPSTPQKGSGKPPKK